MLPEDQGEQVQATFDGDTRLDHQVLPRQCRLDLSPVALISLVSPQEVQATESGGWLWQINCILSGAG